ncbi:hypothetical protein [Hymenobacter psoromatis]|uniref:hypothetical protein n=1 Tax=Hymenobacter psoromatis TaxID=1484116 RepID=UPI001CBCDC18|nr:hypothetical protein [Hymenobacter psoromatis]
MRFLLTLLLFLPFAALAQTPAAANKQLFDRTIDELNFRTFETVYDKHFTRQKFPATLRTAAARRQFTNFEGNAELQKLFLNYNDGAEHYKTRFGTGPLTLAEFEKQLSGVLRDRNFEFFIRGLPRDEKAALVRNEQRAIKQATAQFNASANPAAQPTPPQPEEPLATPAPLTTNGPAPGDEPAAAPAAEPGIRPASAPADGPSPGPGWVGYLTLLLSLGSFGLLLLVVFSLLPEMRRLRRQVRTLETEQAYYSAAPEADAPYPPDGTPTPPAEPVPSFFSRFRPHATGELPADQYDEEEIS